MLTAETKQLRELESDKTKSGVAKFSRWRMAHAKLHFNVQPGEYGAPFLPHDLQTRQLLDPLHLAELNMAKSHAWKHGILNNSSDDARDLISEKLKEWLEAPP